MLLVIAKTMPYERELAPIVVTSHFDQLCAFPDREFSRKFVVSLQTELLGPVNYDSEFMWRSSPPPRSVYKVLLDKVPFSLGQGRRGWLLRNVAFIVFPEELWQ